MMATATQIEKLRTEAAQAGDEKMVRICDLALADGEGSPQWYECARVIAEAAQPEGTDP